MNIQGLFHQEPSMLSHWHLILSSSIWWIIEVWIVEYADYQLRHGPVETPPTPPLYLHLPDGTWRSRSWNMPTTNYSYTLSNSLIVLLLCFNLSVMISSVHITSIVHPGEGSSSVALLKGSSLFFPREGLFGSFSWSDVRSKVTDVYMYRL